LGVRFPSGVQTKIVINLFSERVDEKENRIRKRELHE